MVALLFFSVLLAGSPQESTKTPAEPTKTAPQRTSTKRPTAQTRTVVGTITELDATKNTLTLQPDNGTAALALTIPADAAFTLKGEIAKLTDFKIQDKISIRVSIRPDRPTEGVLKTLRDADTAAATKKKVAAIFTGTVVSSSLTNLDATDKDGTVTRFRISEKTIFLKDGKPAKATDFVAGSSVSVAARSLPSGNLLASHIADTLKAVEQAKNDSLLTWTGQVTEKKDSLVTLKRDDGATRTLQIAERSLGLFEKLTPGRRVHLHIVKGEADKDGHRSTDKFTNAR